MIPFYRPTVSVQELEEHNPQLEDLGRWYRFRHAKLGMKAAVYTETRNVKGARVVQDGDPYLPGVEAVPLDEDHVSITKPKSDKSQLYTGVRAFIRKCLSGMAVADALAGDQREMPQVQEFEGGVFLVRNDQGGIRQFTLEIVNSFAPRLPVALTPNPVLEADPYRDGKPLPRLLLLPAISWILRNRAGSQGLFHRRHLPDEGQRVPGFSRGSHLGFQRQAHGTSRDTAEDGTRDPVAEHLDLLGPDQAEPGDSPGGQSFQAAVALSRAIGKWLLDGLHVADLILEDYFQARQRKRDLLGSSTGADLSRR